MTADNKVHQPTRWVYDPRWASWTLYRAGDYAPMVETEPDLALTNEDIEVLIRTLDESGFIKPRLDDKLRQDDLKITHRLLDIVDRLTEVDEGIGQAQVEELITTHVVAHRATAHRD